MAAAVQTLRAPACVGKAFDKTGCFSVVIVSINYYVVLSCQPALGRDHMQGMKLLQLRTRNHV